MVEDGDIPQDEWTEEIKELNIEYYGVSVHRQEPNLLWFCSEEVGNLEAIAAILRRALNKFDLDNVVEIQWSNTCSKPRTDGFGGGAVIFDKNREEWVNTYQWLVEKRKEFQPKE
jgi:hypothetical protein